MVERLVPVLAMTLAMTLAAVLSMLPVGHAAAQSAPGHERRIALVVGVGGYAHVETLHNPGNDKKLMGGKLGDLGFELFGIDVDDPDLVRFNALIDEFVAAAATADVAVVYYSGHAFQLGGVNYLVPADARLLHRDAIAAETVRLDTLIDRLQARERQVLVFLDACRNNPLPPSQRDFDGLAQVATGNGVFIAFATEPGDISYDGRSDLSPFTRAVATHIGTQGQSISDMMIAVRNDVERQTLYQQTPWDQSSLTRQFFFNPIAAPLASLPPQLPPELLAKLSESEISTLQRSMTIPPNFQMIAPAPKPREDNVITIPSAPAEIFDEGELAVAVQTELKRIGCYGMEVDGVWGRGSRAALTRYYETRQLQPTGYEPTRFHLNNLRKETGTICVEPAVPQRVRTVSRPPAASSPARSRPAARATARAAPKPAPVPAPAPAKPKRSLSGTQVLGGFR